jgi:hypothetical protein
MTVTPEALDTLFAAREALISQFRRRADAATSRRFLSSFHALDPDWSAIGFGGDIAELPAVRWKLLNLRRLPCSRRPAERPVDVRDVLGVCPRRVS